MPILARAASASFTISFFVLIVACGGTGARKGPGTVGLPCGDNNGETDGTCEPGLECSTWGQRIEGAKNARLTGPNCLAFITAAPGAPCQTPAEAPYSGVVHECGAGQYCDKRTFEEGACTPQLLVGEKCSEHWDCASGSCDLHTQTCVSCATGGCPQNGSSCIDGVCRVPNPHSFNPLTG
jgi:hypothetical protein